MPPTQKDHAYLDIIKLDKTNAHIWLKDVLQNRCQLNTHRHPLLRRSISDNQGHLKSVLLVSYAQPKGAYCVSFHMRSQAAHTASF